MEERKKYGKSLKQCREGVWMSGGVKFRPISTANCACVEKGAQSLLRKQRTAARKRQSVDCRDDHHRRVTISVVLFVVSLYSRGGYYFVFNIPSCTNIDYFLDQKHKFCLSIYSVCRTIFFL